VEEKGTKNTKGVINVKIGRGGQNVKSSKEILLSFITWSRGSWEEKFESHLGQGSRVLGRRKLFRDKPEKA